MVRGILKGVDDTTSPSINPTPSSTSSHVTYLGLVEHGEAVLEVVCGHHACPCPCLRAAAVDGRWRWLWRTCEERVNGDARARAAREAREMRGSRGQTENGTNTEVKTKGCEKRRNECINQLVSLRLPSLLSLPLSMILPRPPTLSAFDNAARYGEYHFFFTPPALAPEAVFFSMFWKKSRALEV